MKTLLLCLLVLNVSLLFAKEIPLSPNDEETRLTLLKEDFFNTSNAYMEFQCHSKSFSAETVEIGKEKFTKVSIPGFASSSIPGHPELPIVTRLIEIPPEAHVSVELISKTVIEFNLSSLEILHPIVPFQPSSERFMKDSQAYTSEYSKSKIVSITEAGTLRGNRLFVLKIQLANYNPKEGKIKFYNDIKLKIHLSGYNLKSLEKIKEKYSSFPVDMALQNVIKSKVFSAFKLHEAPLKYLVISDPCFKNVLPSFCSYKVSKGYKVTVKYTDEIGNTLDQIKACIQKEYDQPEDGIVPTFLVLVGDHKKIPGYPSVYSKNLTDLYYATLKGNDCLPDVFYGRFVAQTSEELGYQINKSILYEKGEIDPFDSHLTLIYHYNDCIHKLSQNLAILQSNFWQGKNALECCPLVGDPGVKDYWRDCSTRNEGSRASVTLKTNEYCQFDRMDGTYNIGPSGKFEVDFMGFWGGNIYKSQGRPNKVSISCNNAGFVTIPATLSDGSRWSLTQTCSMIWKIQATGCSSKSQYSLKGEGYSIGAMKRVDISYITNAKPENILVIKPESDPASFTIYGGSLALVHNFEFFLAIREQYKYVYADSTVEWRDTFNMSKIVKTEPYALASQMAYLAYYHSSPLFWASPHFKIRIVPMASKE